VPLAQTHGLRCRRGSRLESGGNPTRPGPWTADRKQPHPEVATAECSVSGIGMMTDLG
jgi:hypothetical protein